MVCWYQQALRGAFFEKTETLVEFKRIQAMADAIPMVVPANTVAFRKGRQHRLGRLPRPLHCRSDDSKQRAGYILLDMQLERTDRGCPRNDKIIRKRRD